MRPARRKSRTTSRACKPSGRNRIEGRRSHERRPFSLPFERLGRSRDERRRHSRRDPDPRSRTRLRTARAADGRAGGRHGLRRGRMGLPRRPDRRGATSVSPAASLPMHGSAKIAAIRETIEETAVPAGLSPHRRDREHCLDIQAALAAGEEFDEIVDQAGLALDLDALTPLARWVPRFHAKRRFDTLFFVARAPDGDWHAERRRARMHRRALGERRRSARARPRGRVAAHLPDPPHARTAGAARLVRRDRRRRPRARDRADQPLGGRGRTASASSPFPTASDFPSRASGWRASGEGNSTGSPSGCLFLALLGAAYRLRARLCPAPSAGLSLDPARSP